MAHVFKRGVYEPKSLQEHKNLKSLSRAELIKIAKERNVDVEDDFNKLEIINALSRSRGE